MGIASLNPSYASGASALFLLVAGHDVGPQRLDVGGLEHIAPRRHVVLALDHGSCKARELPGRKGSQIEAAAGVVHLPPVTRHTIGRVELGAVADLRLRELLRLGAGARRRARFRRVSGARSYRVAALAARFARQRGAGEHDAEAADLAK